ncbi:MAG: hypothetical protein MSA13_06020 [Prevotella sp.]|nr:hypothetical protein [Prevotella sp.]
MEKILFIKIIFWLVSFIIVSIFFINRQLPHGAAKRCRLHRKGVLLRVRKDAVHTAMSRCADFCPHAVPLRRAVPLTAAEPACRNAPKAEKRLAYAHAMRVPRISMCKIKKKYANTKVFYTLFIKNPFFFIMP